MASYSSAELEELLGVKNHVIRYWEGEIPLIQPEKNSYGKRAYSERDLQIFYRLKYLLYDRRYTLEGAREQLYRELTGEDQDLRSKISALRSELLKLFFSIKVNNTIEADVRGQERLRPSLRPSTKRRKENGAGGKKEKKP